MTRMSRRCVFTAVWAASLSPELKAQSTERGGLVIYAAAAVRIRVDGKVVGMVGRDGTLRLDLSPGAHVVYADHPDYESNRVEIQITANQTTKIALQMRRYSAPQIHTKVNARDFLRQAADEEPGFGLYSYLLFARRPQFGVSRRGARYLAAVDAFLEIETLSSVIVYGKQSDINITYLPVIIVPEERSAESILRQYDYARAQRILSLTNYKSGDGPFILAARQPLTNANSLPTEHLIQDLSAVPPRAVELWVILFMNYALRQRFWERVPREEFLLSLRTYIASGGEKVENLAKSFAAGTWQFNQR